MIVKGSDGSVESIGDFEFSVIMPFYNTEAYIKEAIDSIINQSLGFKNIQLILVDDGSEDGSRSIALDYESRYPDNIFILTQNNQGIGSARNLALKFATGKYISFVDSDDILSKNALASAKPAFNKFNVDVVNIPINLFERNKKFVGSDLKGVIELGDNPEYFLPRLCSSFFKRDILDEFEFETRLPCSEETLYINKVLLKTKKYAHIDNASYCFRKRIEKDSVRDGLSKQKEYYTDRMEYFIKELIDYSLEKYGEVDDFIQLLVIKNVIAIVRNETILEVLDEDEFRKFFDSLKYVLDHISFDIIFKVTNNISLIGFLIAIKNNDIKIDNILENKPTDTFVKKFESDNVLLMSDDKMIDSIADRDLYLDFVDLKYGNLNISGYFKSSFNKKNFFVYAVKEYEDGSTEIINSTSFGYKTRDFSTILRLNWDSFYNFDLKIPISGPKEKSKIKLFVRYQEGDKKITLESPIKFRKYCNISYDSHYYVKDNHIVLFDGVLNVMPYSYSKMIRYEIKGLLKIFKDRNLFYKQALFFRLWHLVLYPIMRRREIWIIMDRIDVADDNGEHFYKYALQQKDGIKKFFAISKDSPDYERINEKYGNVLKFGSIKHRFYYVFADKLISSQGSEFYLNPFRHRSFYLTAGTSYLSFYFLQHGIILHDLSSWLRKYDRNPKLVVTSTPLEYESLISDAYNFDDGVFQLLGLPRYDNLDNKGYKKQIVIMPTWRNYLTNEEMLLESEYFHRFNSFVNNERLIEYAKENGYEILFKPHPELARYIELFDTNDYVQFDENKKYQEVFNESAILITDYSSIFFDFGYLKKPIIYYQYGNDFHFDSETNYFKYETMGFGDIVKDEDALVDKIIEYIDNGCEMEQVYKDRIDKFYKYHDKNNSKRCYDAIRKA